ncbi:MAG: ATP-binding cassette domain-containing protein, partial [Actinomycetota bacterium]|nr:ATP-binding cassette domain-containing protein [Actinomycetota bacterium]
QIASRPRPREILDRYTDEGGPGQMLAVSGPSGSGKTSLLLIAAGLMPADEGEVLLDGVPVAEWSSQARASIGVILQTYGLMPFLTAEENVALPMQARRMPRAAIEEAASTALEEVGLAGTRHRLVSELSGGQKQRVALARAIAGEPEVIIADEPTSELDPENRDRVIKLLVAKASAGSAVAVASHDRHVTAACHRVIRLVHGHVVPGEPRR